MIGCECQKFEVVGLGCCAFCRLQCKLADAPTQQEWVKSTAFQRIDNLRGRSASASCAVASRRSENRKIKGHRRLGATPREFDVASGARSLTEARLEESQHFRRGCISSLGY